MDSITLEDLKFTLDRHVDIILEILGLSHRADTIVGNEMLRGVSGGETYKIYYPLILCSEGRNLVWWLNIYSILLPFD